MESLICWPGYTLSYFAIESNRAPLLEHGGGIDRPGYLDAITNWLVKLSGLISEYVGCGKYLKFCMSGGDPVFTFVNPGASDGSWRWFGGVWERLGGLGDPPWAAIEHYNSGNDLLSGFLPWNMSKPIVLYIRTISNPKYGTETTFSCITNPFLIFIYCGDIVLTWGSLP